MKCVKFQMYADFVTHSLNIFSIEPTRCEHLGSGERGTINETTIDIINHCEFNGTQNLEVALISVVLSVLLLSAVYMISLFMITLYEAEKCKKNMKRLGEFQREFIFTPQLYSRTSAVSGYDPYTPRHSKIGMLWSKLVTLKNGINL